MKVTLMILSGLLLSAVLFLLALTQPRFGTPFANWALGTWGPEGSSTERARLKFPAITTAVAQNLKMPERMETRALEARFNPFGFLPFVSWVSRLEGRDGYIRFNDSGLDEEAGDTKLSDYRAIIDEVGIINIELRLSRPAGQRIVLIEEANGSLRSGALDVRAQGARSTLVFDGEAASNLSVIKGSLRVTGDNFADLAGLVSLAAPDTPPYDVRMAVDIQDDTWRFEFQPDTQVGDSDVTGPLTVNMTGETPVIDADLVSRTLDADDLGIVFGIPIGVGEGETAGPEQTQARETYNQSDRLIPNVVIDFSRLDAVDGNVTYRAESVEDAVLDVTSLELDFEIDGRVVRAPLLRAGFEQGALKAYATLDGTRSPAVTTAEGELGGVAFESLALDPYLRGFAEGRFRLEATGDGFRKAAETLDGEVSIWSMEADILALAVEGAALDLVEAFTVLGENPQDRTYVDARCVALVASFKEGDGDLSPAVVDTDDSLVVVRGNVDLGTERIKLSVRSEAKDASLGTLIGDVGIGGTLRNPELLPFSAETVAQFGIAGVLGSISGGLAALPFIEPGGTEDAPCSSLLARAEEAAGDSASLQE